MPISGSDFDDRPPVDQDLRQRVFEFLAARENGYSAEEIAAELLGVRGLLVSTNERVMQLRPQVQSVLEQLYSEDLILCKEVTNPIRGRGLYYRRKKAPTA